MNLGGIDVSVEVINYYNSIILGQGGHSGEDNACWGQRIYGNQILCVLLCCEPKTALKNSLLEILKSKLLIFFSTTLFGIKNNFFLKIC